MAQARAPVSAGSLSIGPALSYGGAGEVVSLSQVSERSLSMMWIPHLFRGLMEAP